MGIAVFPAAGGGKTTKGQEFNSNGNWTAPAGVNYVTVHCVGGGGGSGGGGATNNGDTFNGSGSGGTTSFGTNLVVSAGGGAGGSFGNLGNFTGGISANGSKVDAPVNSGQGGLSSPYLSNSASPNIFYFPGQAGARKTATVAVTPSTSYAIAIGSGGTGGNVNGNNIGVAGGSGGSGYLSLTWEE
jgi:hypothetical protein